jgi:hypothetical protein
MTENNSFFLLLLSKEKSLMNLNLGHNAVSTYLYTSVDIIQEI